MREPSEAEGPRDSRAGRGLSFYETVSLRVQTLQLMVDTLLVRTLLLCTRLDVLDWM